nr:MAG TPA: hypothetical protein [Caudoviricetes sp.]DAP61675.1 MAG TPA: hypothetical protein [Bacteriophage sp.]
MAHKNHFLSVKKGFVITLIIEDMVLKVNEYIQLKEVGRP